MLHYQPKRKFIFGKVTVHSSNVTTHTNLAVPKVHDGIAPAADLSQNELFYALLAEEQHRANGKKSDNPFDDINWFEDFEELALLELRKR